MVGDILGGRYRILEKIGEGGMAVVYKAQCSLLNRTVAVKVLKPQFASDSAFVERFKREAQSAASLSHPNIVNVYDVGNDDGNYYIVMEYVKGEILKDIIRAQSPLPISRSVRIASQILLALDHAHANLIIHRDIKPHNILVTDTDHVKVTDFGIARALSANNLTEVGMIIGTVSYFSPEQARGGEVGTQSDIYSFGILLYEMLTGRVPFRGDNPISVALQHIQEPPRLPGKINPRIPKTLERIIMRCLAKDPAERYQTAAAVLDDLQGVDVTYVDEKDEPTQVLRVDELPEEQSAAEKELAPTVIQSSSSAMDITAVRTKGSFTPKSVGVAGAYDREGKDMEVPDTDPEPGMGLARKRVIVGAIVAVVMLLVGFTGFAVTYRFFGSLDVQVVAAPDLVGKDESEARALATSLGLKPVVENKEYSSQFEKGQVISQVPLAGTSMKKGNDIRIRVSMGRESVIMPDMQGLTSREAELKLEELGLAIQEIVPQYSDVIEKGRVVAHDPMALMRVDKGTAVKLFISQGPKPESVLVPDLRETSIAAAQATLSGLGLTIGQVDKRLDMSRSEGTIIEQKPAAGTSVEPGTAIDLTYAIGPSSKPDSSKPDSSPSVAKTWLPIKWTVRAPKNGASATDTVYVQIRVTDFYQAENEVYGQFHKIGDTIEKTLELRGDRWTVQIVQITESGSEIVWEKKSGG